MSLNLKLRYQDPHALTEDELQQAVKDVFEAAEALGPERMCALVTAAKDRLGLSWSELSALTGYSMPTVFSWVRWQRDNEE